MSKVLETNLCKINYSNSLQELSNETVKLLQDKIIEYKELFNIELDEKIIVNYFDNLEEFREFIYKIRGERKSLPKYANGTYDEGLFTFPSQYYTLSVIGEYLGLEGPDRQHFP